MEPIEGSETSAIINQTPGNYHKGNLLYSVHGESLKSRKHILFSGFFFFENRTVYDIMWKNTVEPDRAQVKIRRMRIACWAPTSTNAHPEHVILIAFIMQQFLHDRA